MSTKGRSRADENKSIRQEALRESLSNGGHIQHVVEICGELNDLTIEMDALAIQRKRAVMDTKLKLVNKYLPDVKSIELSGGDKAIEIDNKWVIEVVSPDDA